MLITQSPVVELRQYVLKPGAADDLVEVFEAEFVESQEALGMAIGGLFHDRDDADRFVWMRGFSSMEARRDALGAFYGGPVWKQHGPAANATMIDATTYCCCDSTEPPHPPSPGPAASGRPRRRVTSGSSSPLMHEPRPRAVGRASVVLARHSRRSPVPDRLAPHHDRSTPALLPRPRPFPNVRDYPIRRA